ncbi:MAG: hypothetical protein P8Y12_06435, partial [Gammaproteobacteria bacterium]
MRVIKRFYASLAVIACIGFSSPSVAQFGTPFPAQSNPMGSMMNPMAMMNPMTMMNPMMFMMPMSGFSSMTGGMGNPMVPMMNPSNWMNPNAYMAFMNPNSYTAMMNPMSYMAFMNPGTYMQLMNPNAYMAMMNPMFGAMGMGGTGYPSGTNMFDPNSFANMFGGMGGSGNAG